MKKGNEKYSQSNKKTSELQVTNMRLKYSKINFLKKVKFSKFTSLCYQCFLFWTLVIQKTAGEEIGTSLFLSATSTYWKTSHISLLFWNWDDYFVILNVIRVIRLLLVEIYLLLEMSIWFIWLIAIIST